MSETEQIICQLKELADFSAGCVSGDMPDCEGALRLAAATIERLCGAFAQIAGPIEPDDTGTPLYERMRRIAREALS